MPYLFDSHIHLFEFGYKNRSLSDRIGVGQDEVDYYKPLVSEHGGEAALVVGYAGEDWCRDNNAYLSRLIPKHDWINALAFVDRLDHLDIAMLEHWRRSSFVGLSLYLFDQAQLEQLSHVPSDVWQWLEEHHWLISVNGKTESWRSWRPILDRHETLRLLISHLGLPQPADATLNSATTYEQLETVLVLAAYRQTHVKLSGFYALVDSDCSHQCAWPYVEAALEKFGDERLLWGSDYSPHLDFVGFVETLNVITKAPFLNEQAVGKILGQNLKELLAAIPRMDTR